MPGRRVGAAATATPANGGKTLIVKVGHKGRYVGVLGAFKKNGGFELHYQLVPLDEFYVTPGRRGEAKKQRRPAAARELLQDRSRLQDAERQLVPRGLPRKPHAAQIAEPMANLSYVGSDACKACHAAEHAAWAKTPHGHALDTLEKIAKRPSLRNFDPECVQCHTVGFEHETGYVDEKKTPN